MVLSGLVSRPELNGAIGVLVEWVEVKERWSVKVKTKACNANEEAPKEEELLGLKTGNLTLVAAPPGRVDDTRACINWQHAIRGCCERGFSFRSFLVIYLDVDAIFGLVQVLARDARE